MENNENNSRGIFYAIMGVATLVITIIGATFAYFTATTNSNVNAVTAGGATIKLDYSQVATGLKNNLVPINEAMSQFAKGTFTNTAGVTYSFVGIDSKDCKDVNGNNICSVYQFTITNPSTNTVSQRVYATLEPGTNSFTNLYYALFKGTEDQIVAKNGFDVDGTAVTTNSTDYTNTSDANYQYTKNANDASRKHVIANKGDLVIGMTKFTKGSTTPITLAPCEQVLDVGESMTYTLVLWIHETGGPQNDDQGKQFAATIRFTTQGNSTGVTGVLSTNS